MQKIQKRPGSLLAFVANSLTCLLLFLSAQEFNFAICLFYEPAFAFIFSSTVKINDGLPLTGDLLCLFKSLRFDSCVC